MIHTNVAEGVQPFIPKKTNTVINMGKKRDKGGNLVIACSALVFHSLSPSFSSGLLSAILSPLQAAQQSPLFCFDERVKMRGGERRRRWERRYIDEVRGQAVKKIIDLWPRQDIPTGERIPSLAVCIKCFPPFWA